ncbi:Intraflagellar transport protein 80 [Trichostrongylus colubriformis]|uniref:Intraflagellar transport protein 80 n=1 Tax=Trichostrongylus colubriformis TaxID=6319 RepID=A0AAN8IB30_TRICO
MRLKVSHARIPRHLDSVAAVGWSSGDEIFSCGDDHLLMKWKLANMESTMVTEMPSTFFATSMHWFPTSVRHDAHGDVFALSSSDGQIHFVNKMGRMEKSVTAHKGAALMVRWSADGTGLLSCGEDGAVKLWSRNAMLRSVIAQMPQPVYCCSFDSTSNYVLFPNYDHCYIRSLKSQGPPLKWKAHDGLVLCCDWSKASEYIVTGGEDCKFKLWDSFGRNLFTSITHDYPISSVAWSPDGQCFAVGSYNILLLCDKAGWSHSLEKLSTGSLLSLCWFDDSTQLVGGTGNGQVIHAHIIENTETCGSVEVVQVKRNTLKIRDLSVDLAQEQLETRDRISRFSIAYDQLVVVTTQQLYIFSSKNWNTPIIVELKEKAIKLILQASKVFLVSDGQTLFVFSYEGRSLSEIKLPKGKSSLINSKTTSLSNDTVALVDRDETSLIYLFDPMSAKPQGDGQITHEHGIMELTLCQCGPIADRMLAFRDSEGAVFIAKVKAHGVAQKIVKIGSSVEQLLFNDVTNMLVGIGDSRIVIWPAVEIAFVDRSLLERSVMEKQVTGLGKFPVLRSFTGSTVTLRRSDGSVITTLVPPFASSLLQNVSQSKWDQAIRLCRQVKNDAIWAVLAGLSTAAKHLYTSEIAYGVLEEVEKAAMLSKTRSQSNREVSSAKTALLAGKINEAEALFERGRSIFQAVMLNIILLRWTRAIDLAIKHNSYLEIVMGYRQRYLEKLGRKETDKTFLRHMGEVEIDFDHIREAVAELEATEEATG